MWKTSLKLAARSLAKDKLSSFISILGLSAGLAVSCFVLFLLWNQVTHDTFHRASDRLYRVTSQLQTSDATNAFATSPAPLAPRLESDIASVEAATRLRRGPSTLAPVSPSEATTGIRVTTFYTDTSFFELFGFSLQTGSAERLSEPNTAVLTTRTASRLFGRTDVVGESVLIPEHGPVRVVATMDPTDHRSHLEFGALISLSTRTAGPAGPGQGDWEGTADQFYTYLRLSPSATSTGVADAIEEIRMERAATEATSGSVFTVQGLSLQPVGDIMIGPPLQNENAQGVLPTTLALILTLLAATVLLGAAFNYVNLSVARGLSRSREVGVRKTMGASRGRVMIPFIVESLLIALAALAIGLVFLALLVPAFNQLWAVQQIGMTIDLGVGLVVYAAFIGFAALIGVAAGLYPAWKLAGFEAAEVLRSRGARAESSLFSWITPRKTLIVAQFVLSVVVAISAVVLYQQTRHMETTDYGFRSERLLQVQAQEADAGVLKRRIEALPGVESVSLINYLPMSHSLQEVAVDAATIPDARSDVVYYAVDADVFDQLSFPVLAGSIAPGRFESGRTAVINASAVESFGFDEPSSAIGQSIEIQGNDPEAVEITGVVPDFTYSYFESTQRPILFRHDASAFNAVLARYAPGKEKEVRTGIKTVFASLDGVNPFDAASVDALIGRIVSPLADLGRILALMAGLAAAIGVLGLLGMTTFSVRSRMREIAIRKALGASIPTLAYRLSREYVALVAAGIVLGLPVAWWINALWLQELEVHVDVGMLAVLGTALVLSVVAIATVLPKTIRAAMISPVQVLRDE